MEFIEKFVNELQALEEGTKRRVLVVGTIVIMSVVVYLWVGYFGSLINTPQELAQAPQSAAQTPAESSGNFWQNMEKGAAYIYNAFKGPRQYDIKPQQ